jgi:hypothetical protein
MEPYNIHHPDTRDSLQRALNRIELCTYTIQEAHYEVDLPTDPEHKADLLLAVEALAMEALDLLSTARYMAWGPEEGSEEC